MRKKKERFSLGGDSAESSENAAKKRCVDSVKKPVHVSRGSIAEICRQGGKQQQQQHACASGGHTDNGSRLIGGNVVAAKETVPHVELDSSSASLFRSIPLQQLRALARAAEVGGSTRASRLDPHLRNQVLSSSSGLGASSSAAGREERRKQLLGRPVGHQEREKPKNRLTGQRLDPTSKIAKKSCNKRLPAEVSCRRPHYATGQPLVCTSVLPACCVEELSPSPRRVGHTSHKCDDVCPSVTGGSAGGSSSSRRTPAKNPQGEGESYVRNGDSGGCTRISASILSCLGNEDAKAQLNAASHNGPAKRLVSPEATAVSERDALPGGAQHQLATEEPLQAHGMASLMERTRGKNLHRLQQEREAALQRHLKCLRSLRVRVGAEGKGAARTNSSRVGREVRDPRFSEACGPLDLRMVGKAYAFLDKMRKQEAEELQRLVKKSGRAVQIAVGAAAGTTGEGRGRSGEKLRLAMAENEAAQKALQRLRSQEEARKRKGVELTVKGQLAREEKARIAQTGKKPFFVSRRALNRLVQAEWQKTRHGENAYGQRRAAKQEERKARNKLAKERRQRLLPVRRYVETAGF